MAEEALATAEARARPAEALVEHRVARRSLRAAPSRRQGSECSIALASWAGDTDRFAVTGGELLLNEVNSAEMYFTTAFCPDQEVFVEAVTMDSGTEAWIVNLKAQDFSGCNQLEVGYDPGNDEVWIASCSGGSWSTHASKASVLIIPGDVVGARARADGTVEVYQNGNLLMSTSVTTFSGFSLGGHIGLEIYNPTLAQRWDDFGGGP